MTKLYIITVREGVFLKNGRIRELLDDENVEMKK